MTTVDTRMLVEATERHSHTYLDKDLTVDSFLDQTVHAHEHGVSLTELGRLILDERVNKKAHE